ncbi:MAG: AAA family ATPase [Terracidiphilus sp.]
MSSFIQNPDLLHDGQLTIAIVSPDRQRRIAATGALAQCGNVGAREFSDYPSSLDEAMHQLEHGFDAILIDIDTDPEYALHLVEGLCIAASAIVMVFSAHAESELMLRSMRAGAREFFTLPFSTSVIAKALLWVAAHRHPAPVVKKADGRLLVFFGSKGGVGVTTLASNFAVALAEESGQSTLLIDLNLNLGDAALNLGIESQYSILDAFQDHSLLDTALLSKFIVQHSSGLFVLAAPAELPSDVATNVAIGCLMAVARQRFHYVVVDAGKKIDLQQMHLFEESYTAFLVTQVGIPELRNANRLVSQFAHDHSPALEIVINRHQPNFLGFTDEHLSKALTRPVGWKVPNDFKAVRQMQSSTIPIVSQDSPIARTIRQMARSVCGRTNSAATDSSRNLSKVGFHLPWKSAAKPRTPDHAQPVGLTS